MVLNTLTASPYLLAMFRYLLAAPWLPSTSAEFGISGTQNSAPGCRRLITYSMSEYEMKQSICFSFRILQKLNIKIFRQCSPKLPKKTQSELEFQTYLRASG